MVFPAVSAPARRHPGRASALNLFREQSSLKRERRATSGVSPCPQAVLGELCGEFFSMVFPAVPALNPFSETENAVRLPGCSPCPQAVLGELCGDLFFMVFPAVSAPRR